MKKPARHTRLARLTCGVVCLLAVAITSRPAAAATPQEVDEAIKKAKAYLYKEIKGDNWEMTAKPTLDDEGKGKASVTGWQWGGVTATAVYGLLAAGDNPKNEPKLKAAVEWLKNADIRGHYASGMRAQVWHLLKDEHEGKISSRKDFELLLKALIGNGAGTGFYSYYTDTKGVPQKDYFDRSVSQISVLGMWACEQAGQEVPLLYWQVVDAAWKKAQKADGGWNYRDDAKNNAPVTGTMTAAGIATLFITQDYLLNAQFGRWSICKGGERNEWIERGLSWMDQHAPKLLTTESAHYYYQLYGIERIGVASGRKYFGTTDWYAVGAENLVRKQNKDGSWGANGGHNPKSVPDTVFSILFLVRGRAPVVMNKLEYEVAATAPATPVSTGGKADDKAKKQTTIPDPWNQRPRDVANFASWAGKMTEEYLNWQVVNLKVAAADLHDAPILYIAGSYPLNFNPQEVQKLREFCQGGGLILGNADCGNASFAKSFVDLGHELFPHYEMRELEKTHPIYMDQMFRSNRWKTQPRVMGLSNGVRELMLLIPEADLGKWFQLRSEKTRLEMYELMQDIFLYSVDKKGLQERGTTYIVRKNPKVAPEKSLSVARLLVGDNSDPEPGGWRRMAAILHNTAKLDIKTEEIRLGQGKLAGFHFAHLTGTTKFKFTDEAKAELKEWVQKGGTLLVDAAGGSNDFATSAERELSALFGSTTSTEGAELGQILPPENPLYSAHKIEKFSYRQFVRGKISGGLNVPRVHAIMIENRPAVLYSREDLSAGMVGEEVDGVLGYTPETATSIVRNIVLSVAAKSGSAVAKSEEKPAPAKTPAKTTPTPKPKK